MKVELTSEEAIELITASKTISELLPEYSGNAVLESARKKLLAAYMTPSE